MAAVRTLGQQWANDIGSIHNSFIQRFAPSPARQVQLPGRADEHKHQTT